jgi:hypothetical protein
MKLLGVRPASALLPFELGLLIEPSPSSLIIASD